MRAVEPGKLHELDAQMWPVGAALIRIWLEPVSASATKVHMAETLTSGIGRLLPDAIQAPLLRARNAEALWRLNDIAVHRDAR